MLPHTTGQSGFPGWEVELHPESPVNWRNMVSLLLAVHTNSALDMMVLTHFLPNSPSVRAQILTRGRSRYKAKTKGWEEQGKREAQGSKATRELVVAVLFPLVHSSLSAHLKVLQIVAKLIS